MTLEPRPEKPETATCKQIGAATHVDQLAAMEMAR